MRFDMYRVEKRIVIRPHNVRASGIPLDGTHHRTYLPTVGL
ncbi:hypothetical protein [Sulfitobacter sp. M22]|nr:hypothetical protein [Sulfitobacter sp. M22]